MLGEALTSISHGHSRAELNDGKGSQSALRCLGWHLGGGGFGRDVVQKWAEKNSYGHLSTSLWITGKYGEEGGFLFNQNMGGNQEVEFRQGVGT